MNNEIEKRKDDHILFALDDSVESDMDTLLDCVRLIPRNFPGINPDDVDLGVEFLGAKISAPIIIGALTGGTAKAGIINERLAKAAELYKIPLMVGSQRIMLGSRKKDVMDSFRIIRSYIDTVPVIGNIGISQIIESAFSKSNPYKADAILSNNESGMGNSIGRSSKIEEILDEIIDGIEADAVAVHLNIIQEMVQARGDKAFAGALDALLVCRDILKDRGVELIVKETGAGLSPDDILLLRTNGIHIFDLGGLGGTNFVKIEYLRNIENTGGNDDQNATPGKNGFIGGRIAAIFKDWGIPTAAAVVFANDICSKFDSSRTIDKIIAGGGIRTGLDVARAIALGADFASIARPFLVAANRSEKDVQLLIESLINELRISCTLVGAADIKSLKKIRKVLLPPLSDWIGSLDA